MPENRDYQVLLLTSTPSQLEPVTEIARRNFQNVTILHWEHGNKATKPEVMRRIDEIGFNLIISYTSGLILKPHHLQKAHFGALNIHPAPPEHGGFWGIWCQPVICRSVRTHHGIVAHEIDEQIDHGPIYAVKRWDVAEDASIRSVAKRALADSLTMLDELVSELGRSTIGTRCFPRSDETWHPTNRNHTLRDVRSWFDGLDPGHPAHKERVPFNHPRGLPSPPYFDDL